MAKKARLQRKRHGNERVLKELAGAAALAGAATVAGKLARDRLSGADGRDAFRLSPAEPTAEGVRRVARVQLGEARSGLGGASKRKLPPAVHDTRKTLKRLRASVRLARHGLGDEVYARENAAFRDAGRRLASARDATVLLETLGELEQGPELPREATAKLRTRLEDERDRALSALRSDDAAVAAVVGELESAEARAAGWPFASSGFEALEPGLERIYRRGRGAMRRARQEPTGENLHEWRKRVKDLWHALQLLQAAAPKRLTKLAKRAHRLSDLLGDDHDLRVLRSYAAARPACFDDAGRQALDALIERRSAALESQAFELGQRLYADSPKRFTKTIAKRWAKRSRQAAAAAG